MSLKNGNYIKLKKRGIHMISCPGCGGNVKFDIPSQKLKCDHCHESYDPYAFDEKTSDAEESTTVENDYEVTIFTCPQCGGEILSTDNAAAGFCSFCGASTILYSRISHERRPNYIIPFKKSKEDCKQAYTDLMKHAIFAPKELKDPKYIDGFRGIYMPYWAYYITQKGYLSLHGEKSHRSGDYIITDHFDLGGNLDCYYKGLSYDASSSFADSISEALAPYDVKGMKAFTPAYLSGFYADTADVAPSVYQPQAEQTADEQTMKKLKKNSAFAGYSIKEPHDSKAALHTKTAHVDSTMFPVWFMSYQKNARIAYVTVNGQTGKVVADIPVDPKKYLFASFLLAVPVFALLALCFTLLPTRLLTISGLLAVCTTIIYSSEISAIVKKDQHLDDLGRLYKTDPGQIGIQNAKQAEKKIKKQQTAGTNLIKGIIWMMVIVTLGSTLLPVLISGSKNINFSLVLWLVIVIVMAVTVSIGISSQRKIPAYQSVLGYLAGSAAVITGTVITMLHPASDLYYYGGTIAALIAVALTIVDIIRFHNILSTRKLPQFNKSGGDDRA